MRVRKHFAFVIAFTIAAAALGTLSTVAADSEAEPSDPLERLLNPTILDAGFSYATRLHHVSQDSVTILSAFGTPAPTRQEALRRYLIARGLDLSETSPTKLFYNDRTGLLTVRGTLRDLDAIEAALTELAIAPPRSI